MNGQREIDMQAVVGSFASDLFQGRHVVVSGGSSGIGQAIARGFASLGAAVTATGSSPEKLAASRREPANAGIGFAPLDVRDTASVEAFFAERPAVDVLVNAQGIARPGAEWTEATFLDVMDVNLNSAFRLTMAAIGKLEASRGSVVNFASMLSYLADAEVPSYTASKTGIIGLTRALAHRFGAAGVRVNAIAPGYHRTDMTRPLWESPADEKRIAERSALKRWGSVDDLVGVVLFLSSPAASFISGVTVPVDGGYHSG